MIKPKLDLNVIQRLYDFGGLMVHRVSYFDPTKFEVVSLPPTFSEEHAKALAESYRSFDVSTVSELVKFDGAFSVKI